MDLNLLTKDKIINVMSIHWSFILFGYQERSIGLLEIELIMVEAMDVIFIPDI